MESCAGGAETVSVTLMFWLVPAQGLGAIQVTTIEVWFTPGERLSAEGSRLTAMAPGVEPPPVTSKGATTARQA